MPEALKLNQVQTAALDEKIETLLSNAEAEVGQVLFELLRYTQEVDSIAHTIKVFDLFLLQVDSNFDRTRALILALQGANEESRLQLFDKYAKQLNEQALTYLISFTKRETHKRVRILLHGYIQNILFTLNSKSFAIFSDYYAYSCNDQFKQNLYFDLALASPKFAKLTAKKRKSFILHFLNNNAYSIVDNFGKMAHDIAKNLAIEPSDIQSQINAITFLGNSSENEEFEDFFHSLLEKKYDLAVRRAVFVAFTNLIEMKHRKQLFKYLKVETDEVILLALIGLVKKFRDTSHIETLTRMLDDNNAPSVIKTLIATLCSFETKRSFQLIKKAFQAGQHSASTVLVYKGYDFKQIEIKNLIKNSSTGEIYGLIGHILVILGGERNERLQLANLYNLLELFWFSKSGDFYQFTVNSFIKQTGEFEQFKLTIHYLMNIINTEEEPLAIIAAGLLSDISLQYYDTHYPTTDANSIIAHEYLYTKILSMNSTCHPIVRLILLKYYGFFGDEKHQFHNNKIIQRFGFTILEFLFMQFSGNKRKQNAALCFLYQNFDAFLQTPEDSIAVLSEAFKQFMYKHPNPFNIFLQKYFSKEHITELRKKPLILKRLENHLRYLMQKALDVVMKKTISNLTETISNLFQINTIDQLETFLEMKIQPRFHASVLPKLKASNRKSPKPMTEKHLEDSGSTMFDQIIELLES